MIDELLYQLEEGKLISCMYDTFIVLLEIIDSKGYNGTVNIVNGLFKVKLKI